jgi:hypothetical protein
MVFWVVTPFFLVGGYRLFEATCCPPPPPGVWATPSFVACLYNLTDSLLYTLEPWRRRQHAPPKRLYLSIRLSDVTTQKTIITVVETSKLASLSYCEFIQTKYSKSIIFWDMTPCSLLSCNRRFGRTYSLLIQGRRNNSARTSWSYPRRRYSS